MAANDNPYLALLQQEQKPPGWAEILQHISNLGFGLAGGLGQAASQGGSTIGGLGTGLILGNQMNAQAAQRAEQERMKRLEWQFKAQEHEDKRAELLRNQAAIDAYVKAPGFQVAPQSGPLLGPGGTPTTGPGTPDQKAIGGMESGNNYAAVGPVANKAGNRAYGKYQIMDFNIGPWTQEVLGKAMTPQEFTAPGNEKAQDAVFNAKFGQYSQKYGPVGASRAWFAGEGGMNNPSASDVNGMTVQRYGDQFAKARGVAPAAVGPSGVSPPPGGPRGLPAAAPGGAGPTLSALPAFKGPGLENTIQPGALPAGVEPKVNLPAPFVPPPPQVAQGDAVTPGGSPIDRNAPAPTFMQPGGPNVVQAQYAPTPATPPMAPPPRLRALPPELEARINSLVGLPRGVGLTIAQAEKMKEDARAAQYQGDLKAWEVGQQAATEQRKIEAQKAAEQRKLETELVPMRDRTTGEVKAVTKAEALRGAQSGQFIPLEASKEARAEAEAALAKAKDARDAAQAAVGPDGRPQQGPLEAKAAAATAEAKARADVEMQNKPALQFAEKEVARFSETVQPQAEAASSGLPNLYEMKRLTEGNMATGPLVDARILGARALDWLNIRDMPEGMVNTTEYVNRAAKGVISVLQTGALGKTQISEGDRKFVEKMAAQDVTVSKQELQRLVDIAIDASHKTLDQHGKGVDRIGRLVGDKVAKDYFRVDRQTYEEWKAANQPPDKQGKPGTTAAPASAQGGTTGAQPPAAGAVAQPKTEAEYKALPRGTPYIHPTLGPKVKP